MSKDFAMQAVTSLTPTQSIKGVEDEEYLKRIGNAITNANFLAGVSAANKQGEVCQPRPGKDSKGEYIVKAYYTSFFGIIQAMFTPLHIVKYINNLIKLTRKEDLFTFSGTPEEALEITREAYRNLEEFKLPKTDTVVRVGSNFLFN